MWRKKNDVKLENCQKIFTNTNHYYCSTVKCFVTSKTDFTEIRLDNFPVYRIFIT